jgi:hypothetical protein
MNDEKSITEKLTDAIGKAADSVKSVASTLVDKASNAAQHAMEANAQKISRIPPAKTDPERVAGTTNEQIYIPEAGDAAAMPMPLVAAAPARKKRKAAVKPAAAKAPPAKVTSAPKKTTKKMTKKAAKKKTPATKSANKAAKKTAAKKTKKAAEKSSVRSSKKARRKSKKQEL